MALGVEKEVARNAGFEPIEVIPTGAALGAEIRGVDLKNIDASQFAVIKRAWHDHEVILVRGQTLSDQDLIAFSRRLGDLDWAPVQETGRRFVEGLPEIYIVSNVLVNGEPIGSLGDGEAVWHTDMSYLDVPPKASMLYSLEVPPTGGNTHGSTPGASATSSCGTTAAPCTAAMHSIPRAGVSCIAPRSRASSDLPEHQLDGNRKT